MKKLFYLILISFVLIPIKILAKDTFNVNGTNNEEVIEKDKGEDSLNLNSSSAILIDNSSGKILYEKNADQKQPMASMTKIMSMLLIMEQIENNNLSYDDKVIISKNASSMGGSQVFLQVGEEYKVEDLLKCIAISSANDAVVAMAEKISGSEANFVKAMNAKAEELSLTNTHFDNPHGLDSENHYSTARDMSRLAQELLKHEEILKFTSIYEDYLTKPDGSQVWLVNTNRLVRFYEGVDGLKTGYTTKAGYCLTATAKKEDLRLISVVMNASSADNRSKDTATLLTYGFNTFKNYIIYPQDKPLGEIQVLNGKQAKVKVYLTKNATTILSVTEKPGEYTFNIKADKIKAPLSKNSKVGTAEVIDMNGNIIDEIDLIIKEDLAKANFWDYFKKNLELLTGGK